ncbi:inorganic phosphate transporter [Solimonas terrae]|uniref:Inorganic phosphate transporter n=1 Tax=Solimonas terrae TaxID=1396819 RepID=A0A6M2BQP5_9GAMM|nr:inorganic phosphate transporter [Solimonas terrae]NGY04535.1 inorganic phosphate transporter [Solimonas terrae]
MEHVTLHVIIFLIVLALAFDFINGFHDAANSIATVVSTGVLKPQFAVVFAAFFNFVAYFIFPLKVAATIGKGTIDPGIIDHYVIFGALAGAIVWNLITWYFGLPSSSSHALIGGLVGAGICKGGMGSLIWSGLLKTIAFIVLSPLLGFVLGSILTLAVSWIFFHSTQRRVDTLFRRLQLVSASLYSLGHGGNDAQKTAGIIWMLLIATTASDPGVLPHWMHAHADHLPGWIVGACYVTIATGTMFGGWRIVKTMGQKITKLKPVGGFCAEVGGAATLFIASGFGIPVSTTHTITGAIMGVGATRRFSAVRWGVAGSIVWAWTLTIPASAIIAALAWHLGHLVL